MNFSKGTLLFLMIILLVVAFQFEISSTAHNKISVEVLQIVKHKECCQTLLDNYSISRSIPPMKLKSIQGENYAIVYSTIPKVFHLPTLQDITNPNIILETYDTDYYSIGYPMVVDDAFYWIAPNTSTKSVLCRCFTINDEKDPPVFQEAWAETIIPLEEENNEDGFLQIWRNYLKIDVHNGFLLLQIDQRLVLYNLVERRMIWMKEDDNYSQLKYVSIANNTTATIVNDSKRQIQGLDLQTGNVIWSQSLLESSLLGIIPCRIPLHRIQDTGDYRPGVNMQNNAFLAFSRSSKGDFLSGSCSCCSTDEYFNAYTVATQTGEILSKQRISFEKDRMLPITGYQIFDSDFPMYNNHMIFTFFENSDNITPVLVSIDIQPPHSVQKMPLDVSEKIDYLWDCALSSPISWKGFFLFSFSKTIFENGSIVIVNPKSGLTIDMIRISEKHELVSPSNFFKQGSIVIINSEDYVFLLKLL